MGNPKNSTALVITGAALPITARASAVLERAGGNAVFAAEEFFKATLNNVHTRRAYGRIVGRFLAWCDDRCLELRMVTPGFAGEYLSSLEGSAPTKNQALAALRHFFDAMVMRHAVPILECVQRNANGSYTAKFGYDNSTGAVVTIPVGTNNYITPGAQNRGQTTMFQPGRVRNAFSLTFTISATDTSPAWLLKGPDGLGRVVTATIAVLGCP